MALQAGRAGRNRSSTSAYRGLRGDEAESRAAELIRQLCFHENGRESEQVSRLADIVVELRTLFADDGTVRDVFRRGKGFEGALDVLSKLTIAGEPSNVQPALALLDKILLALADCLREHRGNQRYFSQRVDGWRQLHEALHRLQSQMLETCAAGSSGTNVSALYTSLCQLAIDNEFFGLPLGDTVGGFSGAEGRRAAEGAPFADHWTFKNPYAARVAVQLAIAAAGSISDVRDNKLREMVAGALRTVTTLAGQSTRNAVAIWNTGILSDVLRVVFDDGADTAFKQISQELMLRLAEFGLGALDDVARLFGQARLSVPAQDLLLTMLRKSKCPAFVQFDLTITGYSSIEIPSLPHAFPPTTGYTLSAWIRLDEYDLTCHTTLFGAFDTSQACFILVYLEKDSHQLILQTSIRSSRPSVRLKSTSFKAGQWYHVTLVHRKASDAWQSPAVLFVNGEFAEQVKCAYPEPPPLYEEKNAPPSPARTQRTKPVQAFFGTPLDFAFKTGRGQVKSKWSLASAHLYATPLTDEFVSVHHKLGVRYCGNFQDCLGPLLTYRASAELNRYNELLHPDKSDKSDILTATDGRGSEIVPESRLLLSINPSAVLEFDSSGDSFNCVQHALNRKALARYQQLAQKAKSIAINAAIPTLNEAIGRSCGTGILTGDPVVAVTKPLDDATWCLAGCLPLTVGLLESASTKDSFLQAARIYFECMEDNWRISEKMEKSHGFGMLALIVREKLGIETSWSANTTRKPAQMLPLEDRRTLPIELLQLILSYVGYDRSRPDNSMIVNPMGYRVLLVDFDTWRRCDVQTQKLYYEQFGHFITHNRHHSFNSKRLIRMRVVRKLVEALKGEDVSRDAIEPLCKALRALLDNSSAATGYKDLAMYVAFGLQDARANAFRPMRSMATTVMSRQRAASWARRGQGSKPSTPGGVSIQTQGAICLSRPELAVHILHLLTRIVCDERTTTPIKRFNRAVPNRWLMHLLSEPDVRVVDMILQIINRALIVLGSDFKAPFVDRNSGSVTLKSRLKMHWKSPMIWLACFSILLGQQLTPLERSQDALSVFILIEKFGVGADTIVANPEVLSAIMAMLEAGLRAAVNDGNGADTTILKTMIQFLSELYARSPAFREFATTSRYTQEILFVLYPVLVGSDRLSAETELQAEKDTLSFKGEEVRMRPHLNSLTSARPPSEA